MKLIAYTITQGGETKYISLDEALRDTRFDATQVVAEGTPELAKGEFILHVEEVQQQALGKLTPLELFSLHIPSSYQKASFAEQMADLLGSTFGKRLVGKVYDTL